MALCMYSRASVSMYVSPFMRACVLDCVRACVRVHVYTDCCLYIGGNVKMASDVTLP